MAKLAELGKNYPCVTEGISIPVDDQTSPMISGDVLEAQFTADRDISIEAAFNALHEVLRMKEQYPEFVLHYVKIETRTITFQYSVAPTGATASPGPVIVLIFLAVAAIISLISLALVLRWTRGYLWSPPLPAGNAVITAKHTETQKGISGIKIYVDGNYVGKTDGGSVSIKDLLVGDHQFAGEPREGFHDPAPVTATIIKDQTINITISYRPVDIPEPKTGDLHVYTTPVSGIVYIDSVEKGPAPIAIELSIGNHTVGFAPVEGYITPPVQTVTIVGGETVTVTGIYILPGAEEEWYMKLLRYALIGGGAIAGAALILPPVIRALRTKTGKQE